jgi:type I restriction enzyme S subunit
MNKLNEKRPGYKKTRVGWIPEAWECARFGDIATFLGGNAFSSRDSVHSGIRWLKIANVGVNKIVWDETDYLPHAFLETYSSYSLVEADIVMALTRPILNGELKLAIITSKDVPCLLNQRVARLQSFNNSNLGFIYYLCQRSYFIYLMNVAMAGTDPPNIGFSDLKRLLVPFPPLPEQKKIAEILSAWNRAIEQVGKLIETKQRLKKGLMQQLLTGRMRFPEFGKPVREKGELPEGWKNKNFGSFGLFSKGKGISNSEKRGTGFPCITYGEIYTRHEFVIKEFHSFIDRDTAQKSQRIQRGDIIFAGSGETLDEIGKCVAYTQDEEAYAGGDIIIFRPKGVDSVYLSYLF